MQNKYNNKTVGKVLAGEKWIKTSKLNSKGKADWADKIEQAKFDIFPNLNNSQMNDKKVGTLYSKPTETSGLTALDNELHCRKCGIITKAERIAFNIDSLDASTKCSGCKKTPKCQRMELPLP